MPWPFAFDPVGEQLRSTNREGHGKDPSRQDHQPRPRRLRPGGFPQHIGTVEPPMPGRMGDDRRHHDDPHPPRHRAPEEHGQRGNEDAQNSEMADLDPDVEREQRYQKVRPGELQLLLEDVGEAEAVDEAEEPGNDPAPAQAGAHNVLERHVDDGYGDGHFYEGSKPRADRSNVVSGADQRPRVPDSKCRDHGYERFDPAKGNDQAEQKQQMIYAAQKMIDPEPHEPGRGAVPPRRNSHAAAP